MSATKRRGRTLLSAKAGLSGVALAVGVSMTACNLAIDDYYPQIDLSQPPDQRVPRDQAMTPADQSLSPVDQASSGDGAPASDLASMPDGA